MEVDINQENKTTGLSVL